MTSSKEQQLKGLQWTRYTPRARSDSEKADPSVERLRTQSIQVLIRGKWVSVATQYSGHKGIGKPAFEVFTRAWVDKGYAFPPRFRRRT